MVHSWEKLQKQDFRKESIGQDLLDLFIVADRNNQDFF